MSLDFQKVTYVDGSTIIGADNLNNIQDALLDLDDDKVEKVTGKGLSTEDYTSAEKTKLSGIEAGAQVNPGRATPNADGLMSSTDKAKLDGIEQGATAVTVDATLSVTGNAADAKATGDSISAINAKIPAAASSANKLMDAAAVNSAIATAISGVTSFSYEVVQTLPASGAAGTIYLILQSNGGKAQNIYNEYIWIADKWEMLGTTEVDLSQYRTASAQDVIDQEQDERIDDLEQATTSTTLGPAPIVTFDASAADMPLKSLTVNIEPVQSGTGDPSPDNVRPISGRTGCNIYNRKIPSGMIPAEYREVSWIESAGDAYINTGIVPAVTDVYSFQGRFRDITNSVLFGCRSSGTFNDQNQLYLNRFKGNSNEYLVMLICNTANGYLAGYANNIFIDRSPTVQFDIDESDIAILGHTSQEFVPTQPIYLLGFNVLGSNNSNVGGGRLSYFKIEGRCEFISCVRKSDGKPGMYDLVSKAFFVNAGTGEFTVGPDGVSAKQTYPVAFPTEAGTVYGGTLDVVRRKLSTRPYYASYNGETLVGPWVSSMDVYAPGTNPTIGAQVVDIGGVVTEYDLTDIPEILTLYGTNNIWSDTGDITVTYGSYLETIKAHAERLGDSILSAIAPLETTYIATRDYAIGSYLFVGTKFYKVIAAIQTGETITIDTNVKQTAVAEQLLTKPAILG